MSKTEFTPTGPSTYIGVDIRDTNTRLGLFGSLDTPEFVCIATFLLIGVMKSNLISGVKNG